MQYYEPDQWIIRGGHKRSRWLMCDCPEEGLFQNSYVLWANQYGTKIRYFCPSKCGHYIDVQWLDKNGGHGEITRAYIAGEEVNQ